MPKGSTKQASVRVPQDMRERIETLAEQEGRTFSSQIVWLLRGALVQRAASIRRPVALPKLQSN